MNDWRRESDISFGHERGLFTEKSVGEMSIITFDADNAGLGDVGVDGGVSSTFQLSNSVVLLAAVTVETAVGFTNMSVIFLLLATSFIFRSSSFNIIFRLWDPLAYERLISRSREAKTPI